MPPVRKEGPLDTGVLSKKGTRKKRRGSDPKEAFRRGTRENSKGVGSTKGQGPRKQPDLEGRQPARAGNLTPLYNTKPATVQRPAREYKVSHKTEDKRPPERTLGLWDPKQEGSARLQAASPEEEGNKSTTNG